jgi:hypothetical protein
VFQRQICGCSNIVLLINICGESPALRVAANPYGTLKNQTPRVIRLKTCKIVSRCIHSYLIEKTIEFDLWLKKLRDKTARAKILFRLQRVELGYLMMKSSKFDIAEYLDDQEMINEYLNTVLEEGDSNDIQVALGHIAKAIGMSKIAEQTGMSSKIQF